MRIVVTGYRGWLVARTVFEVLEEWLPGPDRSAHQIGVGDASGVDAMTLWWCRTNGVPCQVYHADWDRLGRFAGPARNKAMIDQAQPELVLAFLHPKSRGAVQCAQYARKKGIKVLEIWEGR